MNIEIKSATVVVGAGADICLLNTGLIGACYPYEVGGLTLKFEAAKGTGDSYVRDNFGIVPTVVRTSGA